MQVLHAPDLFAVVEAGLFRSSAVIDSQNIPFLKTLLLKTVLVLSVEPASKPLLAFIDDTPGIRLNHIGAKSTTRALPNLPLSISTPHSQSSWKPLPDETIKEGLEFILQSKNMPCLVCCTSGIHETGAFVGCLRKLCGWNFNSIVVEYRCFAGSKARYLIQQFIELFDVDLITLPRTGNGGSGSGSSSGTAINNGKGAQVGIVKKGEAGGGLSVWFLECLQRVEQLS